MSEHLQRDDIEHDNMAGKSDSKVDEASMLGHFVGQFYIQASASCFLELKSLRRSIRRNSFCALDLLFHLKYFLSCAKVPEASRVFSSSKLVESELS